MKCDKRNSKLEKFEDTVDGVMDWIYDAEVFVSCPVEATYEAVKERTDRLEVDTVEIRQNRTRNFKFSFITFGEKNVSLEK